MHFTRPRARRVLVGALALVVAGGATACGAAPGPGGTPSTPGPSAGASPAPVPAGGVTLQQLGFANGPRGFSLPAGVRVVQRVDQSNVVTLVMDRPSGAELAAWVRAQADHGWIVVADANDSIVLRPGPAASATDPAWEVALTGGETSGLTFRRTAR